MTLAFGRNCCVFVALTTVLVGGCAIDRKEHSPACPRAEVTSPATGPARQPSPRATARSATPVLKMSAFRTGGRFGELVDDATRKNGDPVDYLVLVNDDDEENPDSGIPDNANEQLLMPPSGDRDDDIGRIRLSPPSPIPRSGVLKLELSHPTAVRLFRADGRPLRDLSVRLDRPTGDLAGLASGPVDLWYEVLATDPCFTFRYTYRATTGDSPVRAVDSVNACFAKWMWIGRDGQPLSVHQYIYKAFLLDIARGEVPAGQSEAALDAAVYRIRIEGLPSRAMTSLTAESKDVPSERFKLDVIPSEERTESKQFIIGYDSHRKPPEPLTDEERRLVQEHLGLIAIHESP